MQAISKGSFVVLSATSKNDWRRIRYMALSVAEVSEELELGLVELEVFLPSGSSRRKHLSLSAEKVCELAEMIERYGNLRYGWEVTKDMAYGGKDANRCHFLRSFYDRAASDLRTVVTYGGPVSIGVYAGEQDFGDWVSS